MNQQNPDTNPAKVTPQQDGQRPQDGQHSQGEERSFRQDGQHPEERQDDGRQERDPQIDRQDHGADDVERGAGPR